MKGSNHLRLTAAAAFGLAMLVGVSAFADSRHPNGTFTVRDDRRSSVERYRENDRVQVEGRITSMNRERDGVRVRLDRSGYSFWVPERQLRSRPSEFRIGVSIRLGGIFRGGYIMVDAVDWPNGGYYGDRDSRGRGSEMRHLTGVVQRIDLRRGLLVVRDDRSGRGITVDMVRNGDRPGSIDLDDVRRGDRIDLVGDFSRDGVFRAWRIDDLRKGRW